MRTLLLPLAAALAAVALPATAERADREKEVVVVADKVVADDNKKSSDFVGNVVVTQGTMRMTAAKVTLREDGEGYKYYVASGAPLTFRQKRDKVDEFVEGEALRAEFDDRNDVLRLYNKGRVKSGANEITGDFISYDMRKEVAEVAGAPPGTTAPANSRVKVIILPPKKGAGASTGADSEKAEKNPPLKLKPDAETK